MKHVIDASLLASLILPDESNPIADRFSTLLIQDGAAAPGILQLEIVNILLMALRRKRLSEAQFDDTVKALDDLPIILQPLLTPIERAEAIRLARKHTLTAYDAVYLELCLRLKLPLASFDQALLKAAKIEGAMFSL